MMYFAQTDRAHINAIHLLIHIHTHSLLSHLASDSFSIALYAIHTKRNGSFLLLLLQLATFFSLSFHFSAAFRVFPFSFSLHYSSSFLSYVFFDSFFEEEVDEKKIGVRFFRMVQSTIFCYL